MPYRKRSDRKRSWLIGLVFLLLLILQFPSLAQSVVDWPSPRREQGAWISDRANLIPWPMEYHLHLRLNKLNARTGAELAIATIPKLATQQTPHDFALELFNHWGLGQRHQNNGVLLFVSKADRRIEVITGKGLREVLPDREVSHVIQAEIVPAFQQADYSKGIEQVTIAIAERLETRSPQQLIPAIGPWLIGMIGGGMATIAGIWLIRYSFTAVKVAIPCQGYDETTFKPASQSLANYTLPEMWDRLFQPTGLVSNHETPVRTLLWLSGGGVLCGMGLVLGFWRWVLASSVDDIWQSDAIAWAACAGSSIVALLLLTSCTIRFLPQDRGRILLVQLLVIAATALVGGFLLTLGVPVWLYLFGIMLGINFFGLLIWGLISGDYLQFSRPRLFLSDQTNQPIQELNQYELTSILSTDENLARSQQTLEFRGWRAANLSAPLAREQVYLVRRIPWGAPTVSNSPSYALEDSTEHSIGTAAETVDRMANDNARTEPNSNYDNLYNNYDYSSGGDFGGGDFGGGSSDGGGAGGDW